MATITPLPIPVPSRQDPSNFSVRADQFLGALPAFATEANAVAAEVNQVKTDTETIKQQAVSDTTVIKQQAITDTTAIKQQAVSDTTVIKNETLALRDSAASYASQAAQSFQAAEIQANIAASAAKFKGEWGLSGSYLIGDSVANQGKRYLALRNNTGQSPATATLDWLEIKSTGDLIRPPIAVNPLTGESGVLPNVTLQASNYSPLYSSDSRTYRRFELTTAADGNFASPVFTSEINADSVQVTPNLGLTALYIWRCKDVSVMVDSSVLESDWSVAQEFTTANISITAPTISVTGSPSEVPESPTISTSAFTTVPAGEDTHAFTDWEVRLSSDNTLVWSSYNNNTDKTSIVVPAGVLLESVSYVFRARHHGVIYGASGYGSTTATTVTSFFDIGSDIDGLDTLSTIQQEYNPTTTYAAGAIVVIRKGDLRLVEYKSLVSSNTGNNPESSPTQWQLVIDDNTATSGYLGEVIGSNCVVDKGEWKSTTSYSIGDMVVIKTGTGFTQSDLTAYVAKTANSNKSPASNPADWQQRNGLPTGTSLANTLGLASAAEVLQNNDSGWLKFVHKGEVKYIAKKTFMHTVSWNDIAKAEAVYGNRTVRIGSRLFRVSLLSGAEADPSSWVTSSTSANNKGAGSEWNELVYRVHTTVPISDSTIYHGGAQVGSNWAALTDADLNITGNGGYTWCKEALGYDLSRRVLRGGSSLSGFYSVASSNAGADTSYGWRPCLTLISEPEADSGLYNAEASGVGPGVASLQYDPITDTGFYGETTTTDLYTGTQISAATAVTHGTLQFDTDPWLKFYWHGQVLYIAKKPYRHTVSWDNINTANAVYGVNLGSTGRTRLTKGSMQLDVKLLKGATKDPSPDTSPGRQWDELIYRVAAEVQAGQVGANWGTYTNTDLQITGNGGYSWMQEIYKPDNSYRVVRGNGSLSGFSNLPSSSAHANFGWRPCLALVR